MKSTNKIILVCLGLILEIGLGTFLRSYVGITTSVWVISLLILVILVAWDNKFRPKSRFVPGLLVLIGLGLVRLPLHILNFEDTLLTLPEFLFHFIAVVVSWSTFALKDYWRFTAPFLFAICLYTYHSKGHSMWSQYISYGNFTGVEHIKLEEPILVVDSSGMKYSLNQKGRITVVDFWNTRCTACFRQMPEWHAWAEEYENQSSLIFYSVNIPYPSENKGNAQLTMEKLGYSYPFVKTLDDEVYRLLNFNKVPLVSIFDDQGDMIFRGNMLLAKDKLKQILEQKS